MKQGEQGKGEVRGSQNEKKTGEAKGKGGIALNEANVSDDREERGK